MAAEAAGYGFFARLKASKFSNSLGPRYPYLEGSAVASMTFVAYITIRLSGCNACHSIGLRNANAQPVPIVVIIRQRRRTNHKTIVARRYDANLHAKFIPIYRAFGDALNLGRVNAVNLWWIALSPLVRLILYANRYLKQKCSKRAHSTG
jgi:hypothetical protein